MDLALHQRNVFLDKILPAKQLVKLLLWRSQVDRLAHCQPKEAHHSARAPRHPAFSSQQLQVGLKLTRDGAKPGRVRHLSQRNQLPFANLCVLGERRPRRVRLRPYHAVLLISATSSLFRRRSTLDRFTPFRRPTLTAFARISFRGMIRTVVISRGAALRATRPCLPAYARTPCGCPRSCVSRRRLLLFSRITRGGWLAGRR